MKRRTFLNRARPPHRVPLRWPQPSALLLAATSLKFRQLWWSIPQARRGIDRGIWNEA